MAIKVQWGNDGLPYAVCDGVDEAIELLKRGKLENSQNGSKGHRSPAPTSAPPALGFDDRLARAFDNMSDKGKKLLKGLANHPQGIEAEKLSDELKLTNSGIGGTLGSLSKATTKEGIRFDQLVKSEGRLGNGNRPYRWLEPTALLLEHKGEL